MTSLANDIISTNSEPKFLYHIRCCILSNLGDDTFGVGELAAAMFLSRSQLFRKVKALTGRNVARYIHFVRITEASILLKTTDLSVAEIAWRTGFSDPSYLRRVFLLETGETLASFRRRMRKLAEC